MCKFERTLNTIYLISGAVLLAIVIMCMTSCSSSNYVTSCPAYANVETHQQLQAMSSDSSNCENCDEID